MRDLATQEIEAVNGGCIYRPIVDLDGDSPWIIICPPPPFFDYFA